MNPFKVLNLSTDAESEVVMRAAALALREKRHSAREIAEARRRLMEPALRHMLAFLYFTDVSPLLSPPKREQPPLTADTLRRLEIFEL